MTNSEPGDHEFLTIEETAEWLRIGKRVLYDLAVNGKIPAKKVGGQWRFHRKTVMAWAKDGEKSGPVTEAEKPAILDILVVDDNLVLLPLLGEIIKDCCPSSSIRLAAGGMEALRRVGEKIPDVILLDIDLPDMNGIKVIQHLKASPATAKIPVIAISGFVNMEYEKASLEAGAIAFLEKPLQKEILLDALRKITRPI